MIKTYAVKGDEKILVNSENKDSLVGYEFIQEEYLSEEHFNKLQAGYSYNIETGEFQETPESKEFEKQVLENKKTSLLKEMGELKQIKDGVLLVGEDTTEIDKKIQELKKEYNNL